VLKYPIIVDNTIFYLNINVSGGKFNAFENLYVDLVTIPFFIKKLYLGINNRNPQSKVNIN